MPTFYSGIGPTKDSIMCYIKKEADIDMSDKSDKHVELGIVKCYRLKMSTEINVSLISPPCESTRSDCRCCGIFDQVKGNFPKATLLAPL